MSGGAWQSVLFNGAMPHDRVLQRIRVQYFVGSFPDFGEAHGRMIPVENGHRGADVAYNRPWPTSKKLVLDRMGFGAALFKSYDGPLDGHVSLKGTPIERIDKRTELFILL